MATTLTGLMDPLSGTASSLVSDLQFIQTSVSIDTDALGSQGASPIQALSQNNGGDTNDFGSMGVPAFLEALHVNVDINGHMAQAFQGAAQALSTFTNTLGGLNSEYDGLLTSVSTSDYLSVFPASFDVVEGARAVYASLHANTAMIDEVISGVHGNAVLVDGAADLLSRLGSVHTHLVGQAQSAYVPLPPPDVSTNNNAKAAQARQMVVSALDLLYDNVSPIYSNWGSAVQQAFSTFKSAMNTVHQQVQPYSDLLTNPTSAVSLFDMIHEISGSNDPIAIVQTGPNSIMVMVSGTELNNMVDDTNIWNALGTGMGQRMPYEQDVIDAIRAFNAEHGLANPDITLAGHSLGGMVDEQIAEDEQSLHFNIKQVITFGSPVMGDPVPGVKYNMYAAQWDPIPMLSRYEDPGLPGSLQEVAQEFPAIQTNYINPGWNPFSSHFWKGLGRDIGATYDNIKAVSKNLPNLGALLGDGLEDYAIMGINSLGINAKKSYMDPAGLYGDSIQIVPDLTSMSPGVHSHYGDSTWLAGQHVFPVPSTASFLSNVEYFGMPHEDQTAQINQYMKTHSSLGQLVALKIH